MSCCTNRFVVCLIAVALAFSSPSLTVFAQDSLATKELSDSIPPSEDNLILSSNQVVGIPDNAYTGGFGTNMACSTIAALTIPPGSVVTNASVRVTVQHSWIGDLTIKLRSPNNTVLTILNRPGSNAPDDGTDAPAGDSSNWSNSLITFGDGAGPEAETMGSTIADAQSVCTNDGICGHDPSPDTAVTPPTNFVALRNTSARGAWTLCVGDSALLDVGTLTSWSLDVSYAAVFSASPNITIPDDAYAGGFGGPGMACSTIAVPTLSGGPLVQGVFLNVDINHSWVGDLTLKLRSPNNTIFTILNRPGSNAPDDGTGAVGANANWNGFLLFGDGFGPEAETMGSGLTTDQVVCSANGVCSHDPSPDTATSPASFAAAFNGGAVSTNWTLCVGDSALGDVGQLRTWRLNLVNALAPTAASVSVSGRVVDSFGSTINKARVKLITMTGEERVVLTNPFGHFSFDQVASGETYIVSVEAKEYAFETQTISVADEISDLEFVGRRVLFYKQQ